MIDMGIKKKAIILVMSIISILIGYHFYFVLNKYNKDLNHIKEDFIKQFQILPKLTQDEIKNEYILLSNMLMNNDQIVQALKNRDRDKLYELMKSIYEKALIDSKNSLKVFHFYLPNNQSFLRMHKPSMHSDFANDRASIVKVNEIKQLIIGFEVGKFGFFYRVEIPLFYKNEYLGMLDIGIDFISFLEKVQNLFSNYPSYIALLIKDKYSNILINKKDKLKIDSFLLYHSDNKVFNKILVEQKILNNELIEYSFENKDYILYSRDSFGIDGDLIAKTIYAYDITKEKEFLNESLKFLIIIIIFVLAIIYFILHFSFNSLFAKLQKSSKSVAKLSKIIEKTADNIYIVKKDGTFEYVNPTFTNFLGYSKSEIIGKTPKILKSGYHNQKFYENLWNTILSGKVFRGLFVNMKKNGEIFYEKKTITPVKDENGKVEYFIVIGKDVTKEKLALKKLEEQRKIYQTKIEEMNKTLKERVEEESAKRSEQEKILIEQSRLASMGEMIGNIAHQWRQPLNALSILMANIKSAYDFNRLDEAYINRAMSKSEKLIGKMSTTIDDFRNFFKPDKEKKVFYIFKVIESVLSLLEASMKSYNIEISVNIDKDISINGYENEYSQVVMNLINNAKDVLIEKKIENPKISIFTKEDKDEAILIVKDNGGGIKKEILNRIFEPYFTTKEQGKGTGIGLYMSKTIIEEHMDGKIEVKNIDDGAEFIIIITKV